MMMSFSLDSSNVRKNLLSLRQDVDSLNTNCDNFIEEMKSKMNYFLEFGKNIKENAKNLKEEMAELQIKIDLLKSYEDNRTENRNNLLRAIKEGCCNKCIPIVTFIANEFIYGENECSPVTSLSSQSNVIRELKEISRMDLASQFDEVIEPSSLETNPKKRPCIALLERIFENAPGEKTISPQIIPETVIEEFLTPEKVANAVTPKRERPAWLISPHKSLEKTPKRRRESPNAKSRNQLNRTGRIDPELTAQGVKKLTQTQLNINSFKVSTKREMDNSENVAESESPAVCKFLKFVPESVENSPEQEDLDITRLNVPVASTLQNQGQILNHGFERLKEDIQIIQGPSKVVDRATMRTKEYRKTLPGQDCEHCTKYYSANAGNDPDRFQQLLNKCSRHRTKQNIVENTPPGFWNLFIPSSENPNK